MRSFNIFKPKGLKPLRPLRVYCKSTEASLKQNVEVTEDVEAKAIIEFTEDFAVKEIIEFAENFEEIEDKPQEETVTLKDYIKCTTNEEEEDENEDGYRLLETDDGKIELHIPGGQVHTDQIISKFMEKNDAQIRIKDLLLQKGFQDHLQSTLGGGLSKADASQVVVRVATSLVWTYWQAQNNPEFPLSPGHAIQWFVNLIVVRYKLVPVFCKHLEETRRLSASTVLNNLQALAAGSKWLIIFSELTDCKPADSLGFNEVLRQLRRLYRKKKNESKGDFSMQSAIAARTMPVGGILELQAICKQHGEEFKRKHGGKGPFEIDAKIYREGQAIGFSSMYTFAPQGRQSGISDVKSHQYLDLKEIGHVLSRNFKTVLSHKYQAILNTVETEEWLDLIVYWRPRAVFNFCQNNPGAMEPEHLFLDFEGRPIGDKVGAYVTSFFRSHGLHMTTTGLRSLVETTADQLEKRGIINHAQRAAISHINTHSSKVTQDYYVRNDIAQNVHLARSALSPGTDYLQDSSLSTSPQIGQGFNANGNGYSPATPQAMSTPEGAYRQQSFMIPDSLANSGADSSTRHLWPRRDTCVVIPWGTNHPDYDKVNARTNKPLTRAEWSAAELDYIGRWYHEFRGENPELNRVCSIFLTHIKNDPFAIPIFHAIHTLDTKRIRYGFDAARKAGYLNQSGSAENQGI